MATADRSEIPDKEPSGSRVALLDDASSENTCRQDGLPDIFRPSAIALLQASDLPHSFANAVPLPQLLPQTDRSRPQSGPMRSETAPGADAARPRSQSHRPSFAAFRRADSENGSAHQSPVPAPHAQSASPREGAPQLICCSPSHPHLADQDGSSRNASCSLLP